MKQFKLLIAIALLVSVFAVSCKETPKTEEVEAVETVETSEAVEAIEDAQEVVVAADSLATTVKETVEKVEE